MGEDLSTIAPNDQNIAYSPYTWEVVGTAKTINAGAYFRVAFTGTPSTLIATFNTSNMPASASRVGFRVDGGNWQDFAVAASIPLAVNAGNTWGTHVVEMVVISTTETAVRWGAPQATAVIFTGLTADVAVTTRMARRRSLYGLAVGDSIAEGVRTLNMTAPLDTNRNDSRNAWAYPLADLLGAEIGVVGFGGQGISKTGSGGVPKFSDAAPSLFAGTARSLATPQPPDFIIAHLGTNDAASADATVTADTASLLNYWIGATPSATKIFVMAGWAQTKAAAIQSGIAASSAPSRVVYINTTGWWSAADSSDSLHPYGYVNTIDLAPRLAAAVRPYITATLPAPVAPVKVYTCGPDGSAVPFSATVY